MTPLYNNLLIHTAITTVSGVWLGLNALPSAMTGMFMGFAASRVENTTLAKYPVDKILTVVAGTLLFTVAVLPNLPTASAIYLPLKAFTYLTGASTLFIAIDVLSRYSKAFA